MIGKQALQIARLVFDDAVEADVIPEVPDIRVLEPAQHGCGKLLQLRLGQRQKRDDFFVQQPVEEFRARRLRDGLADRFDACQQRERAKTGMRAIEDRHLARLVGRRVLDDECSLIIFGKRDPQIRHARLLFDDEEMEEFGRRHELVFVSEFLHQRICLGARITGHDAVDQSVVEGIVLLQPGDEGRIEFPFVCMLQNDAPQLVAVMVDEFAGDHLQAGFRLSAECRPALEEKAGHLAGEGNLRRIFELDRWNIGNAGIGSVRDDNGDVGIMCQSQHILPALMRGDLLAHAGDQPRLGDLFAGIVHAAGEDRVDAILFVQREGQTAGDRAKNDDTPVGTGLLVQKVDLPIDERAQEIAFSPLQNARSRAGAVLEKALIETFHISFSLMQRH
ncbi:hypothetical protein D3C73_675470 [compost metagenome]